VRQTVFQLLNYDIHRTQQDGVRHPYRTSQETAEGPSRDSKLRSRRFGTEFGNELVNNCLPDTNGVHGPVG
jgi:hypothetical protein